MYLYLLEESSRDPWYYFFAVMIFASTIGTAKRNIMHFLDPIVFFFIGFSFISSLVLWLLINGYIGIEYAAIYVVCAFSFILGFLLAIPNKKKESNNYISNTTDLKQIKILCYIVTIVTLVTLFLAFTTNALAIFSESPVLDRVAISAANRWFTVIFYACNPIGLALSTLIIINVTKIREKILYFSVILVFLMSFASSGSKAAILSAVIALGSLISYLKSMKYEIPQALKNIALSFVCLSIIYFVYVVSLPGTGDSDALSKLITRIAGSGDNYIYFFVEDQYKQLEFTYNILTYIAHNFTAAFGWKLIPYNIGTAMYGLSTGDYSGFGPNPGYVIEGMIFFGIYLAPLYACTIGYLTNYTRNIFANKPGNLNLILFIIFSVNAPSLPVDINLYIFTVCSSAIIIVPIYHLSLFIAGKPTKLKNV